MLNRIKSAPRNYYESEMERWEETKELGPIGTFKRDFQFGLTGPAPSVQPNEENPFSPTIDTGPSPVDKVNETANEILVTVTGAPGLQHDEPLGGSAAGSFVKILLGIVALFGAIYVIGQLITFNVGGS